MSRRLTELPIPELFSDFASMSKVLVIAPHPDDDVIGCGGTLLLTRRMNPSSEIRIIYLTDGRASGSSSDEDLPAIRRSEALSAAAMLGLAPDDLIFMEQPDRIMKADSSLVDVLAATIQDFAPTDVFVPYPLDSHGDHVTGARASAMALSDYEGVPTCWCYEVWVPLIANRVVDISSVMSQKTQLVSQHRSQLKSVDYVDAVSALNRFRSVSTTGEGYAEAFYCCTKSQLLELTG